MALLTRWDVLESFLNWDSFLEFTPYLYENFIARNVAVLANGMESYNGLINLNTVAVVILIMYARIIYSIIVLVLCCCRKSAHGYTYWRGIFLNEILSIGNETFIDLLFVASLGMKWVKRVDLTKSGEILGFIIDISCILIVTIYCLSILYMLTKSQEELEEEEFQEFMGEIQSGFKLDTPLRR